MRLTVRYALMTVAVLVAPEALGLMGKARAAFQVSLSSGQDLDQLASGALGSSGDTPSDPSEYPNPRLMPGFNYPADANQMGTSGSPTSQNSSSGMPATASESSALAIPFVTLLRRVRERVRGISRPSPVFEPPRRSNSTNIQGDGVV